LPVYEIERRKGPSYTEGHYLSSFISVIKYGRKEANTLKGGNKKEKRGEGAKAAKFTGSGKSGKLGENSGV